MTLLFQAVRREQDTWKTNGFQRVTVEPLQTLEHVEDRLMIIGPHRLNASFYYLKAELPRRASIKPEPTATGAMGVDEEKKPEQLSSQNTTDQPTKSKENAQSLKEALIKNPNVMQLFNPNGKKSGQSHASSGQLLITFDGKQDYFQPPTMMAVGKIGAAADLRVAMHIKRQVNDDEITRVVHAIIKESSQRLYGLFQEAAKDPVKLIQDAEIPLTQFTAAVYKESIISFVPPAELDEDFSVAEPAASTNSIASSKTKPKNPKSSINPTKSSNTATNNTSATGTQANKQCAHCGSKGTPQWRRGPDGAGTLCNACGVKWKHGKLILSKSSSSESVEPDPNKPTTNGRKREPPPQPPPTAGAGSAPSKSSSFVPLKKRKFIRSTEEVQSTAPSQPEHADANPTN